MNMNRFIIEGEPQKIAKSLCDQHVVKMPLEEAQMLCTALWHHAPEYAEEKNLYKPVHQKHPCTLWAMETRTNYFFAFTDTSSYGGTVQVNFGGATCYSISSSVSDDNGYGNFEYSPNITGDGSAKKFYALNSKNLAEFG